MSVCEADVSGNCESLRAKIYLNDEEVEVCSNCLEHAVKNGYVEDGELYYDE